MVRRHMERCGSCHDFARMGHELNIRLTGDAAELIKKTDTALDHRILAALEARPEPSYRRSRKGFRFQPMPILYAALALILVVTGLLVLSPRSGPKDNDNSSLMTRILNTDSISIEESTPVLPKFMAKVESPMNREIDSLKNAVVSAKNYFVSYIGEGFQPSRKTKSN